MLLVVTIDWLTKDFLILVLGKVLLKIMFYKLYVSIVIHLSSKYLIALTGS